LDLGVVFFFTANHKSSPRLERKSTDGAQRYFSCEDFIPAWSRGREFEQTSKDCIIAGRLFLRSLGFLSFFIFHSPFFWATRFLSLCTLEFRAFVRGVARDVPVGYWAS